MSNLNKNLPVYEVLEEKKQLLATYNKDNLHLLFDMFDVDYWQGFYEHMDYVETIDFSAASFNHSAKRIAYVQLNQILPPEAEPLFNILLRDSAVEIVFNPKGLKKISEQLQVLKGIDTASIILKAIPNSLIGSERSWSNISEFKIDVK